MDGRKRLGCLNLGLVLLFLASVAFRGQRVRIQLRRRERAGLVDCRPGFAIRAARTHPKAGRLGRGSVEVIFHSRVGYVSLGAEHVAHRKIVLGCCWRHVRVSFPQCLKFVSKVYPERGKNKSIALSLMRLRKAQSLTKDQSHLLTHGFGKASTGTSRDTVSNKSNLDQHPGS